MTTASERYRRQMRQPDARRLNRPSSGRPLPSEWLAEVDALTAERNWALATIAELNARLAQAAVSQQDALRYQWVRKNTRVDDNDRWVAVFKLPEIHHSYMDMVGDDQVDLDFAIDDAIIKEGSN